MKKIKGLFIFVALLLLIPIVAKAEGKYFNAGDVVKDVDTISHSYFSAGNTVNNETTVDGILFTAGNTVSVDGKSEYSFIAGNMVSVNEKVEKDLFVAGNQVTIGSKAELGRDVYAAAASLVIDSDIKGNAFLGGDSVTINSKKIDGDVSISASEINFAEGLTIKGTLSYNENANVKNLDKITAEKIEKITDIETTSDKIRAVVFSIASLIIVALVINWLFPKVYSYNEDRNTFKDIATAVGVGFLVLICVPLISIVLMVIVIGLPLGLIGLAVYLIALYLSGAFAAKLIGSLILNLFKSADSNTYLELAIGIIVFKLAGLIPVVGGYIIFIGLLYGLGYAFLAFKNRKATEE